MEVRLALLALLSASRAAAASHISSPPFHPIDGLPNRFDSYKVWWRDSLFTSSDHWSAGRLPCPGDRVVFPKELGRVSAHVSRGSTYQEGPSAWKFREMVLPWNGEVVLSEGSSIAILGESARNKDCPGVDVTWRSVSPPSWLDPSNWYDPAIQDVEAEAVPHLMRVPCAQDLIYIDNPAFQIMMPEFKVQVGALFLGEQMGLVFSGQTGQVLEQLEERLFTPRPWLRLSDLLHVSAASTADLIGDPNLCGEPPAPEQDEDDVAARTAAREEIERAVCRHVTCPVPSCSRPVRPHLHCCFICGAVLQVSQVSRYAVHEVVFQVELALATGYPMHVGVVPATLDHPELVQVVVLGDDLDGIVSLILQKLQSAKLGAQVQQWVAGPRVAPATAASVLFTLIGTLGLVVLGLTLLLYAKQPQLMTWTRPPASSFLFARFENAAGAGDSDVGGGGGEPAVEVRVPSRTVMSARGSWSAHSFRNPLYQQSQQSEEESQQSSPRALEEDVSFSELQQRDTEDETISSAVHQDSLILSKAEEKLIVDITL